ncbi:hypothetical protein FRB95_010605 [Tulasnella sp. JGI-2019a]|nr:hypothetical protein FRB95_010605 [Tulasnella sp. JGI-2019a]
MQEAESEVTRDQDELEKERLELNLKSLAGEFDEEDDMPGLLSVSNSEDGDYNWRADEFLSDDSEEIQDKSVEQFPMPDSDIDDCKWDSDELLSDDDKELAEAIRISRLYLQQSDEEDEAGLSGLHMQKRTANLSETWTKT